MNDFKDMTSAQLLDIILQGNEQSDEAMYYVLKERVGERLKDNADDNFLEIVEGTDVFALLEQMPECRTIVTTGGKASEELQAYFVKKGLTVRTPKIGESVVINDNDTLRYDDDNQIEDKFHLHWWRMPSSSRAYPMKLEKKAEYYKRLLEACTECPRISNEYNH